MSEFFRLAKRGREAAGTDPLKITERAPWGQFWSR